MASNIWEFKIPKLSKPPEQLCRQLSGCQPSPLDRASRVPRIEHCIYCRQEHAAESYCYRLSDWSVMGRKRRPRKGDSSSSESESGDDSSESTQSSSEESSDTTSSDGEPATDGIGPPTTSSALAEFYSDQKRVDSKEVTCTLDSATLIHYFKTM